MWCEATFLQSLDTTEYESKERYNTSYIGDVINLVNLYFVLPLFDLNFIFLHFKQMLCEQLLGDCVTKPFQLDNGGSYSSEQQSQK